MQFNNIIFFLTAVSFSTGHYIAGTYDKNVGSPTTSINLGQAQILKANLATDPHFHNRKFRTGYYTGYNYPQMTYDFMPEKYYHHVPFTSTPYMSRLYRRDGGFGRRVGSPDIAVSVDSLTNTDQTAQSMKYY